MADRNDRRVFIEGEYEVVEERDYQDPYEYRYRGI